VGFEPLPPDERPDDAEALRAARLEAAAGTVERLRKMDGIKMLRRFRIADAVLVRASTDEVDVESELAEVDAAEEIYLNFETTTSTPAASDGVSSSRSTAARPSR
jgi:hypothetical protein